ncbi:MAG: hypothetical protein EA383_04805 [Spirochaetaceae bacterium]|nr:MAG: hypothetical protein EA383_04805 [Spirochaetaceae bacterium]
MSDDIFDSDDDIGSEESPDKKGGVLSGLAIQILKWVAIVIGAILFVVTVVVVTLNILQGDEPAGQVFTPSSEVMAEGLDPASFFGGLGEIRGTTSDGAMFVVQLQLGYDEGNARIAAELTQNTPRLRDRARRFFASHTVDALRPANEEILKTELMEQLNAILIGRPIREVLFDEFQVLGM